MQLASRLRYYSRLFGWRGAFDWLVMKTLHRSASLHDFRDPHTGRRLYVRLGTTDAVAYEDVIAKAEYAADFDREPEFIVDCGANVGFAAVFFAHRYPGAKIVAVEPDHSNYEMMLRNVAGIPAIIPIRAAIWNAPGTLSVEHSDSGHWGVRVSDVGSAKARSCSVNAVTIPQIMRNHGLPRIDLLKVDIEGAEVELFSGDTSWVHRVNSIAIELHDRFRTGCTEAFEAAVTGFSRRWTKGENLFVARDRLVE